MVNGIIGFGQQKVGILSTRAEKKLVPVDVDWGSNYESLTASTPPTKYYLSIRIPQTNSYPFVFTFLINPKTISVAHQTLDSHAMTRAGWQFGVWGEDTIDLHISGLTAGQYMSNGLTDGLEEYSLSYRNSMELLNVFENNGYTFEGEELAPGPMAQDITRKRIKSHRDVEIRVGNFIWNGMFTSMSFSSTADTPFFNKFDLGFLAWKESYTSNSPWRSPLPNSVYRGHASEILDIPTSTTGVTGALSPSASSILGGTPLG
jgi:hypothetical protein